MVTYTVPGMKSDDAERVVKLLQDRLNALNDLALTLKHVHWNVTGPNFIAVHMMLDPQVEAVRHARAALGQLGPRVALAQLTPAQRDRCPPLNAGKRPLPPALAEASWHRRLAGAYAFPR
jgi:ferritin-like protein